MIGDPPKSRRRWPRIGMLPAVGLLLLSMLILRLAWGAWVGWQLERQLAQIRQRGEPADPSDLVFEPVPDAENAWTIQRQAMAALVQGVESPRSSLLEYAHYPPYPPEWHRLARASEQAHQQAFARARQARTLLRVQIRKELDLKRPEDLFRQLNNVRWLGNTLADAAVYANLQGRDAEAVERLLDLYHLARSVRHDEAMIGQLVAIGLDDLACTAIQIVGPGLRLDGGSTDEHARPQAVRQLIGELLDERLVWEGFRKSLLIERLFGMAMDERLAEGTVAIGPLAARESIRRNHNSTIMIEAARLENKPDAFAVLSRCRWDEPNPMRMGGLGSLFGAPEPEPTIPRYSRWFNSFSANLSGFFERHFRNLAHRRAAAVSLACQLYRADHGRYPDRLDDMVPKYLPSPPADPFHADGRAMGYTLLRGSLPDGGDRPIIYFGVDESELAVGNTPQYEWIMDLRPGVAARQYRDVSRFAPPPSPETVDDDPDEADAPGEDAQADHNAE